MNKHKLIVSITASIILIIAVIGLAYNTVRQRSESEQQAYLSALELDDKIFSITSVDKKDGYVALGVSDGVGGAAYFLKENDATYEIIAGPLQEQPFCSVMNEAGVPQKLYGECYLDK